MLIVNNAWEINSQVTLIRYALTLFFKYLVYVFCYWIFINRKRLTLVK